MRPDRLERNEVEQGADFSLLRYAFCRLDTCRRQYKMPSNYRRHKAPSQPTITPLEPISTSRMMTKCSIALQSERSWQHVQGAGAMSINGPDVAHPLCSPPSKQASLSAQEIVNHVQLADLAPTGFSFISWHGRRDGRRGTGQGWAGSWLRVACLSSILMANAEVLPCCSVMSLRQARNSCLIALQAEVVHFHHDQHS